MTDSDRARLRRTFTEAAETYDRARPGHPPQVYADLAALAGIRPGCRVLEAGCGTGRATVPLAERGCRIDAVELGAELAAVARRNLAGHPGATVHVAAFEDWPLPPEPYDLVLAATSFHWLDPAVRVARSAATLRPGGFLAILATHHVAGGSRQFFADVQDRYERFDPATPPGLHPTAADDIPYDSQEAPGRTVPQHNATLPGADLFEPAVYRRHLRDLTYTTRQYLDLLRTHSGTRALAPDARAALLDSIGRLIDRDHGGTVTERYPTELRLARRTDRAARPGSTRSPGARHSEDGHRTHTRESKA
ncbi:class I SAM-dependent methyltransferase [Streptomyces sp. NPDC088785]|uniref:class I SAM-dependent methyltransferase n=1 Tax=Streptomyces sp. NPDC088785 TaxID=3365897 RepID=UPI003818AB66